MGLAQEFTNLGEEFIGSFDARVKFLGENIVGVKKHKAATHRFLGNARKQHKAMGRKLKADLGSFVDDLEGSVEDLRKKFQKDHKTMGKKQRAGLVAFVTDLADTVDNLREEFQKEQNAVHRDCKAAHRAWQRVSKTMAAKRRNFKGALSKAKQHAAKVH